MDRALYDGDVALFGIHIHLFEFVSGVAFFGGDEAGRHLHAGETEGEVVLDVFLIVDTTAESESLSQQWFPKKKVIDLSLSFSSFGRIGIEERWWWPC